VSAARIIYLFCDSNPGALDCIHRTGSSQLGGDALFNTLAEAREDARKYGWHPRPGGRDICPECWEAGRR
jgi:hypothetical protein